MGEISRRQWALVTPYIRVAGSTQALYRRRLADAIQAASSSECVASESCRITVMSPSIARSKSVGEIVKLNRHLARALWRRATVEQAAAIFLAAQRCSALFGIGWVAARRSDAPVCARPPVDATTIRSRPPLGGPAFHRAGHYLPRSLPTP